MMRRVFSLLSPSSSSSSSPVGIGCRMVHHHMERDNLALFMGIVRSRRARANRNTHINEKKFRKLRAKKTALIELPDDEEERSLKTMTPSQNFPSRPVSWTRLSKVNELYSRGLQWYRNWWYGLRMIRSKRGLEKFTVKEFATKADQIFNDAHLALAARNKKALHKLVTETAFAKMWPDVEKGSIKWQFVETIEPSQVVSVRVQEMPPKSGNQIAQLVVRMHSKQVLAVYDRFGHLILGSESEPRSILEFVVFEHHIASIDGQWRVHDKVIPQWMPSKTSALQTRQLEQVKEEKRPSSSAVAQSSA